MPTRYIAMIARSSLSRPMVSVGSLHDLSHHHAGGIVRFRTTSEEPHRGGSIVAHRVGTARGNLYQHRCAPVEHTALNRCTLAFIPVQRPGRSRQTYEDFLFMQVKMIPADGSRRRRSQVHVGDATEK